MHVGETLSSNTLFHFTSKREYIENIIDHGFHPRYCTEDFSAFAPAFPGTTKLFDIGVPMVCFCDIPLSKVKEHISVYKGYGIGCSKGWGIDKGITPLIYVKPTSETALGIKNALVSLNSLSETELNDSYIPKLKLVRENLIRLMKFVKPYEGRFEHSGEVFENKRFYDEREWRYIPEITVGDIPNWIEKDAITIALSIVRALEDDTGLVGYPEGDVHWVNNYLKANPALKDLGNNELSQKLFDAFRQEMNTKLALTPDPKMQIDPTSLKYIIVEKDEDVKPIVEKLEKRFEDQPFTVVKRLITRIITLEQIKDDF